jgi:cyclase
LEHPKGRLEEIKTDIFGVLWADDDSAYGGFGANQGFVVLEESVLLFDSGMSTRHAKWLKKVISKVTDKKVRYLINSHDHSDHIFGNSFFFDQYEKTGLISISHERCSDQIKRLGKKRMKGYRAIPDLRPVLDSLRIVPPSITYSNLGFTVEIEGREFVLAHPRTGAHTLGDTYLCLPKEGVMFAGDIVWNKFLPNVEDANLEGWVETLEDLDLNMYSNFLPGHGEPCGGREISQFLSYLRSVKENLAQIELRGKTVDSKEQRFCFDIPGTETWKLRSIIEYNVDALFHPEGQLRLK